MNRSVPPQAASCNLGADLSACPSSCPSSQQRHPLTNGVALPIHVSLSSTGLGQNTPPPQDSDAGDEEPLVQPPNRASDCLAQPNCTSRVVGQDETLSGHVVLRGGRLKRI